MMFEPDKHTDEIVTKLLLGGGGESLTLQEYIKDKCNCNDTKHAQIRKNVFTRGGAPEISEGGAEGAPLGPPPAPR